MRHLQIYRDLQDTFLCPECSEKSSHAQVGHLFYLFLLLKLNIIGTLVYEISFLPAQDFNENLFNAELCDFLHTKYNSEEF